MKIMKTLLSNTKFNPIIFFFLIFCTNFYPLQSNPSYITKSSDYYIVKKGDTLFSIARNFNIDVTILMKLNNLQSSKIYIGESLIVK